MMLPALATTITAVPPSHIVSPPSSPTQTSSSHPRTGRLRGLSYLRHYTHGHHNHQSPPSPASPTVTATNAAPTSPPTSFSPRLSSPQEQDTAPPRQRRATSPLNNTAANSWIPTVSGVSGLSRVASSPAAAGLSTSLVHVTDIPPSRIRSPEFPDVPPPAVRSIDETIFPEQQGQTTMSAPTSPGIGNPRLQATPEQQPMPSIRFTPHIDIRSNRESLHFSPIERSLRKKDERIKVGRCPDRDNANPNAPVGFKSKVVSRRHCEFWCDNGQWCVKDVKSSSGTFLNHIRLSPPGVESKPFPINDGDILQLGIDFKGGEEQIYRCVKIRVELNRAWQKALNNFNMSAHRRLRNLAKSGKDSDTHSINSSECAICLLPVAPCQCLFVAPCSHVWHYKCIRPLIEKEYPAFLCPNCRAMADLDREIEEDEFAESIWEPVPQEALEEQSDSQDFLAASPQPPAPPALATTAGVTVATNTENVAAAAISAPSLHATVDPVSIRNTPSDSSSSSDGAGGNGMGGGPMTPMNDAGPFVLDGEGIGSDPSERRKALYLPLAGETPEKRK